MGYSTSRCPSCPFEISNNLSTRSTTSNLRRLSRPPRWSQCDRAGFDVYLEPKDLDEKVADLHFLALSNTRCGTHGPHPYQASSGSICLPRWSPCDRVGFRPTANSGLMLCSFTLQVQAQLDLLRNPTRTKSYKNDFQLLPEDARRESVDMAPSFTRCGAHRVYSGTRSFPSVPRLKTLSWVSTTAIEPRRNQNSSRIELIRSVRALCGLRLTHDGLNDFSP